MFLSRWMDWIIDAQITIFWDHIFFMLLTFCMFPSGICSKMQMELNPNRPHIWTNRNDILMTINTYTIVRWNRQIDRCHKNHFLWTVMYVDNNPVEWDKLRNIITLCFNLAGITLTMIPDTICCLALFVFLFPSLVLSLFVFVSLSDGLPLCFPPLSHLFLCLYGIPSLFCMTVTCWVKVRVGWGDAEWIRKEESQIANV